MPVWRPLHKLHLHLQLRPAPELKTPDFSKPRYVYTDAFGYDRDRWDYQSVQHSKKPLIVPLAFLSSAQRTAVEAEWKQINGEPPWGATYINREVVAFARKHPDDKRVPEALHRAVQASYYRLTDKNTGTYSKQAFDLLHRQYPKSDWAARTKYWYK
jgi:hypothetical protein